MKDVRALVYYPGRRSELVLLASFEHLQRLCGGYVERIILDVDKRTRPWRIIQLWCNEDGISLRLPPNLLALGPTYRPPAPIFGVAVLAAAVRTPNDEEEVPLTDEEVARWSDAFPRSLIAPAEE